MTAAAALAAALVGFGVSSADAGFTLDVRLSATQPAGVTVSGKTATLASSVAAGTAVNLEVWGVVTGANGVTTDDGLQDAFFGVASTPGTGATTGNLSTVSLADTWKGTITGGSTGNGGAQFGTAGNLNVGSTNDASPTGWVFARSTTMQSGAAFQLGTLTYTVGTLGSAGSSTSVNSFVRGTSATNQWFPALWKEDGATKDGTAGSVLGAGTAIDIKVAAGTAALKGDVNGDGLVNAGDINPFVFALGNTETAFYAQYPGGVYLNADLNGASNAGDGLVNAADINPFVARLGGQEPEVLAALAAVPEPSALGLLGVAALGLVARRRKA